MFRFIALAILCVSVVSATEDVKALREEAQSHGSNMTTGLTDLNDKWLRTLEESFVDPWSYVELYKRWNVTHLAGDRLDEWNVFMAIDYKKCDPIQIGSMKKTVAAADADWHRLGAKWKQVGVKYYVQEIILGVVEKHAQFCLGTYESQAFDLVKHETSGDTKRFISALNKVASRTCSPGRVLWTKLRPSSERGQLYYSCVRDNAGIFTRALAFDYVTGSLNRDSASKLVEQGKQACQEYVGKLASLFEMVHYDSEVIPGQKRYGSRQLNALWAGYETCKELLRRDNGGLVESLVGYEAPTKMEEVSDSLVEEVKSGSADSEDFEELESKRR